MNENECFSEIGYAALLEELRDSGYEFRDFFSFACDRRHLIIRHDVDYSLEYAVRIGEIDEKAGARATFFVLLATEFYNIFSGAGRSYLQELIRQGHEIGLHFDRSAYAGADVNLDDAARTECDILERLLGKPVRITAFHRPAQTPEVLGMSGLFAGRIHAYAPEVFKDIAYVSDGAGYWSHGSPLEHPAIKEGTAMQMLTHPYLWMGETSGTAIEKIEAFRHARERFLISELQRNLRYYPKDGSETP